MIVRLFMANLKQAVIIRTDLGFPVGLIASQVAHIHFNKFRRAITDGQEISSEEKEWMKDPYLYVYGVPNIESLQLVGADAKRLNLPICEWKDTVLIKISEEKKEAVYDVPVGFSIGPCDSDKMRPITKDLDLL